MKKTLYFFYMVRCIDQSIYSGITTDVKRRVEEHNSSKLGAKYTRYKQPVTLVHWESYDSRSEALKREAEVKSYSRQKKEALINSSVSPS